MDAPATIKSIRPLMVIPRSSAKRTSFPTVISSGGCSVMHLPSSPACHWNLDLTALAHKMRNPAASTWSVRRATEEQHRSVYDPAVARPGGHFVQDKTERWFHLCQQASVE